VADYADLVRADRRLTILRLLEQSDDYSANQYLLHAALPGLGHACSEDTVRTELDWLAEQGLVRIEVTGGVAIAHLTSRGQDAATGRARIPGVKRPRPE